MNLKQKGRTLKVNTPGKTPGTQGGKSTPQTIQHTPKPNVNGYKTHSPSQKKSLQEDLGQR